MEVGRDNRGLVGADLWKTGLGGSVLSVKRAILYEGVDFCLWDSTFPWEAVRLMRSSCCEGENTSCPFNFCIVSSRASSIAT